MSTATINIETEKQLIPELRFKEFDGDWKVSKLGDYCTFSQGIQVDIELQAREPKKGYIKFLRIENYTQKSQDFRYIPLDVAGKKRIKADEIAVVRYGATAGFISKGFDGVLANNLFKVIPDEERFTLPFLFEHLNSHRAFSFFQAEMSGGAMPALSFGIVKALKVPVTSLPEQQKIASFLSAVDEKIQQLNKKAALLVQYKKGVMQQLFSGKLRFKDEDGNGYPDWEEKRLLEFCSFFSGGTPSSTNKEFYSGTIPFIGSGNIYDSEVFSFISEEALNSSSAKIVEAGDLLYALYGANSGELSISKLEGAINQAILCIRTKQSIQYLYYVLLYNKEKIVAKYLQGGQGNLSAQIIKKLKYKFPSLPEQQKIARYLSSIDTKIESVSNQITQTQSFKKGLLQQLFV